MNKSMQGMGRVLLVVTALVVWTLSGVVEANAGQTVGGLEYMFPKPGQTQLSQKWSYVKAVKMEGGTGLIGAGFYSE